MNWTAILALVIANVLQFIAGRSLVAELRNARHYAGEAMKRADYAESMKYCAQAQANENRQEADRWKRLHDSLLVRQQNRAVRSSSRGTERDANG